MTSPRSVLKDVITDLPDDWKMKTAGVPNFLKKKQVKDEELQHSGMYDNLLKAGNEKMSKEDLVNMEANRSDIFDETRVHGGYESYRAKDVPGSDYSINVTRYRSMDDIDEVVVGERYNPRTDTTEVIKEVGPVKRDVASHFNRVNDYLMHSRTDKAVINGLPTRRVHEIQSDLHQRGRRVGYTDKPGLQTPGNTPFKDNWSTKAIERELLAASDEGSAAIAIPIDGPGVRPLTRGSGVQTWYETKVRSTMKKLAKKIGGKYVETAKAPKPETSFKTWTEDGVEDISFRAQRGELDPAAREEFEAIQQRFADDYEEVHGVRPTWDAIDERTEEYLYDLAADGEEAFRLEHPALVELMYKDKDFTVTKLDDITPVLENTGEFSERLAAMPQAKYQLDQIYRTIKRKQSVPGEIPVGELQQWAKKFPTWRLREEAPALFGMLKLGGQDVFNLARETLRSPNVSTELKASMESLKTMAAKNRAINSTYLDPEAEAEVRSLMNLDAWNTADAVAELLRDLDINFSEVEKFKLLKEHPELANLRYAKATTAGNKVKQDPNEVNYGQIILPEGEEWKKKLTLYTTGGAVAGQGLLGSDEAAAMPSPEEVQDSLDFLMNETGMPRAEATKLLNETLQEDIEELRAEGYTMSEIQEVYGDVLNYEPTLLEGSSPDGPRQLIELGEPGKPINELTENLVNSLTESAKNVREEYLPIFGEVKARYWDEDTVAHREYQDREEAITYDVANVLRGHGYDVRINHDTGDLEWHDGDTVKPITPSLWDSFQAMEAEALGIIVGGAGALAAVTKYIPGAGKLVKVPATFTGMALGATSGRMLDGAKNAWFTRQHLKNDYYERRFKDSLVGSATIELLVGGALETARFGGKGLGWIWDTFRAGNRQGAYDALKEHRNLSDQDIERIVELWSKYTDAPTKKMHPQDTAIEAVMQTQPGAETWVGAAGGLNSKMSAAMQATIDQRAKSLLANSAKLTNDNVGVVLYDELGKYKDTVKSYYRGIKDIGTRSLADTNYTFDYDKLAIAPQLAKMENTITNPAVQERFMRLTEKMREIGSPEGPRDFKALLDLRASVNDFAYNTKIRSAVGYDTINAVRNKLDKEIERAAKKHMTNGNAWLTEWGKANIEYGKMKTVQKNTLYKALTKKGVTPKQVINALKNNVDSIDGTFMEVVGKLPTRTRNQVEGAVMDTLVKKYTIGDDAGFQAVDFPTLATELRHIGFANPEARKLKRAVTEMAEIFKNDVHLAAATGHVSKPAFQSYLTTDPIVRAKFEMASHMFSYIKKYSPSQAGKEVALMRRMAKIMQNPRDAKAIEEVTKQLGDDPAMLDSIKRLAIESAKFGEPEHYPYVKAFRTGEIDSHKAKQGKLGKGLYWSTEKDTVRTRAAELESRVVDKDILPGRIATMDDVKRIMGDVPFEELKDNPKFIETMKDRGYDGLTQDSDILIFKD